MDLFTFEQRKAMPFVFQGMLEYVECACAYNWLVHNAMSYEECYVWIAWYNNRYLKLTSDNKGIHNTRGNDNAWGEAEGY